MKTVCSNFSDREKYCLKLIALESKFVQLVELIVTSLSSPVLLDLYFYYIIYPVTMAPMG